MATVLRTANDSKLSKEEQILNTFQAIREEQRQIVTTLTDIEQDESELKVVISALEKVDGNRKCYRLIGGVLCEKTVKDVLPVLLDRKEKITKLQVTLKDDLTKKGAELNEFKEKHNIRIQGKDDIPSSAGDKDAASAPPGILNKP